MPGASPVARPNVLVLVLDTTRADRCSVGGYDRPTTPCLERFAADAVVFDEAWSPGGWTGPAHASLFTGLRPEHHGFHDGNRYYLGAGATTLAERFSRAGYATGCFTNNNWIAPEWGLSRGFDVVDPIYARHETTAYPWAAATHDLAAAWAEEQAAAGKPFFLFVNDMEAHLPYRPPEADARRFLRGEPTNDELADALAYDFPRPLRFALRAEELSARQTSVLSDLYDAEIAALDREVGVLLDRFRASGLLDSTVVVILSDHGEMLGEHSMMEHGHSLHRAVRHVPLVVRYPGPFDGGRHERDVVRLEDVAPTLFELCGLARPPSLDGRSLTRDLGGRVSIAVQGENPNKRKFVEEAVPGFDGTPMTLGIQAVFDGRLHFVRYSDGRSELYDETLDPAERVNLVSTQPAEAARLAGLLPAFE